MKIIISENQYLKILKEETAGLDYFIDFLVDTYPNVDKFKDVVRKFIIDSGCQNIEVKPIKHGASGLALHDKVVYNTTVFSNDLNYAMYVVFHEMAHQYQYKKYGEVKMYQLYTGELPINDAVEFLRHTENVADQFAIRKCRELHKLGLLDRKGLVNHGFYSRIPDMTLKTMLVKFRNIIRSHKVKDPVRVSEILYNSVVNGINNEEQKLDESEIDERSRTLSAARKKRLFPKVAKKYASHRFKPAERIEEDKPLNDKQVKSIEDLNKDAKFLTCKNCRKKFTQTTHKGKKSLPVCPWCGTHNNEQK